MPYVVGCRSASFGGSLRPGLWIYRVTHRARLAPEDGLLHRGYPGFHRLRVAPESPLRPRTRLGLASYGTVYHEIGHLVATDMGRVGNSPAFVLPEMKHPTRTTRSREGTYPPDPSTWFRLYVDRTTERLSCPHR